MTSENTADEFGEYGEEVTEEFEEELEEEDGKSVLTVYDPDDLLSGAVLSSRSTIPADFIEFDHSFGYDCKKYFNICACDDNVVAWAAGCILAFMDVKTKRLWFKRCTTGGGVGHVASNRNSADYRIAVAENREGEFHPPVIVMYTWPQLAIDAVLREGTTNAYSILDFSPDGEYLASIGKEPDYNITIWVWKRHSILLRTSAFTFDVNNVIFSRYCEGQLTTCGAAHIKFWKMAPTFTGLKLKGELGRFGKTEICDVIGVLPMPDEKVLSGCEWGNILVWEAGLVKIEVTQKNRKPCHGGPIVQMMLSEDRAEVTTVGADGAIRSWYWDTAEQADPPEHDLFVELNPVAETIVPGANILSIRHQKDNFWYAQDGNGAIWTIDLDLDNRASKHTKLTSSHSGPIVGVCCIASGSAFMTFGEDGAVQAYDADRNRQTVRKEFVGNGSAIFQVPLKVCPTGECVLLGMSDGTLRAVWIETSGVISGSQSSVQEMFMFKPHSQAVRFITMNDMCTLCLTFGADNTLFMYQVNVSDAPFSLTRLGFISTPPVIYAVWKPMSELELILCCEESVLKEVTLPAIDGKPYEEVSSFQLEFTASRETALRKYFLRNKPLPLEEDLMSLDEEDVKKEKEMALLEDDDEEGPFVGEIELVIDEHEKVPPITWAEFDVNDTDAVWFIQRDLGAIVRIKLSAGKVDKYAPIPDAWSTSITSLMHVCERQFTIYGMSDGIIRAFRNLTEEEDNETVHSIKAIRAEEKRNRQLKGRRLRKAEPPPIPRLDLYDSFYLPMHDRYTGAIVGIAISQDSSKLFTAGRDGNIFSYRVHFEIPLVTPETDGALYTHPELLTDPAEPPEMSHEELKQKEEYDKMMAIANAHKKEVRDKLEKLFEKYDQMLKANRQIAVSQQINVILDPRPPLQLEEELAAAEALERRKLANPLEVSQLALAKVKARNTDQLDVYPFIVKSMKSPNEVVKPLRHKRLSQAFFDQLDEVHRKMEEAAGRARGDDLDTGDPGRGRTRKSRGVEAYGPLPAGACRVPRTLVKAIIEHDRRMLRRWLQDEEIEEHMSRAPNPNVPPPGALEALREAESTLNNYPLKTAADYVSPSDHNTQLKICHARQEIYEIKHEFNIKVEKLRADKLNIVSKIKEICVKLNVIRHEIPKEFHTPLPVVPSIDEEREHPETFLEVSLNEVGSSQRLRGERKRAGDDKLPQARVREPRVPKFRDLYERDSMAARWELLKCKQINELSPFEQEVRERRIRRRTAEQFLLTAEAEKLVKHWEERFLVLQRERIRVQEKSQMVELHLLQLHREIVVFKKFESNEDRLANKVYAKLIQVRAIMAQAEESLLKKKKFEDKIEELQNEITYQQAYFKKLTQDNPFMDFLKRIYKKRYRPPKDPDDDDSSEESSSSSSSEEEDLSLDSRDIGPIRPDPLICPDACDPVLYQKTYDMRAARHQMEQDIKDQEKQIELVKREAESFKKIANKFNIQLQKRQRDLKDFMMEKQSCLNEIFVTLVVRASQIRSAALERDLAGSLVFSEARLSALRRRVGELQREIADQRARRKLNLIHMRRMKTDVKFMEREMEEVKEKSRIVLTHKLGRSLKPGFVLDALLARLARRYNSECAAHVAKRMAFKQIMQCWKNQCEQEQKYVEAVVLYSEKLRQAAALQENAFAVKFVPNLKHIWIDIDEFRRDIARLRILRCRQRKKIEELQRDILRLSYKSVPAHPPPATELATSDTGPESGDYSAVAAPEAHPRHHDIIPNTCTCKTDTTDRDSATIRALTDQILFEGKHEQKKTIAFLTQTTHALKDVYLGKKSRFAVMEKLAKDWLPQREADATTKGFEAIEKLTNFIVTKHIDLLGTSSCPTAKIADEALEGSLMATSKDRTLGSTSMNQTLVLADALNRVMSKAKLDCDASLGSLVASLLDRNIQPSDIQRISVSDVVNIMRDMESGWSASDIEVVVKRVFSGIMAQTLTEDDFVADTGPSHLNIDIKQLKVPEKPPDISDSDSDSD